MLAHRVRVRFALSAARRGVAGAGGGSGGVAGGGAPAQEGEQGSASAGEPEEVPLPSYSFRFRPFDLEGLPEQSGVLADAAGPRLEWAQEVEMEVDEAVVRDIVAAGAQTTFTVERTLGEETLSGSATHSGCGALLVGDCAALRAVPGAALPDSLRDCEDVRLEINVARPETEEVGEGGGGGGGGAQMRLRGSRRPCCRPT